MLPFVKFLTPVLGCDTLQCEGIVARQVDPSGMSKGMRPRGLTVTSPPGLGFRAYCLCLITAGTCAVVIVLAEGGKQGCAMGALDDVVARDRLVLVVPLQAPHHQDMGPKPSVQLDVSFGLVW